MLVLKYTTLKRKSTSNGHNKGINQLKKTVKMTDVKYIIMGIDNHMPSMYMD